MKMRHWWLNLAKDELRLLLALALVLAIFLGVTFAAGETPITFDFGLRQYLASGANLVSETSVYPQRSTEGASYGFTQTSGLLTNSDDTGSALLRDSLSSAQTKTFKITGLTQGAYRLTFGARRAELAVAGIIRTGSQQIAYEANPNETTTKSLVAGTTSTGELAFDVLPGKYPVWTISYFTLERIEGNSPAPSFDLKVEPSSLTAPPNSTVEYQVSVLPINNYAGTVALSVASLPTGLSSEITPPSITPPGSSQLLVHVAENTPSGTYSIAVNAAGNDANRTTRQFVVKLRISTTAPQPPPPSDPNLPKPTPTTPEPIIEVPPPSRANIISQLRELSRSQEAVEDQAPTLDLKDALTSSAFVLWEGAAVQPPQSPGVVGSALDSLTGQGTINRVIDTAPPDVNQYNGEKEKPSYLNRLFRVMFGARLAS